MSQKLDIEKRIADLEHELAAGIALGARKSFESSMVESCESAAEKYLDYLELLKREKDSGFLWQKIKNWG